MTYILINKIIYKTIFYFIFFYIILNNLQNINQFIYSLSIKNYSIVLACVNINLHN